MKVDQLFTYAIKSTRGVSVNTAPVLRTGFENDRVVAIVDQDDKIITGRDHPELLRLQSNIHDGKVSISDGSSVNIAFTLPDYKDTITARLFRNKVLGIPFDRPATKWISDYLQGDFRLAYLGGNHNAVLNKRGGKEGEYKSYSDSSPVHLINSETLNHLNSKLKTKVGTRRFRPNIVVEGAKAFEEDTWSLIDINGCRFRVQERTKRCIFTTIHPETLDKDAHLQPLAKLAELRIKMGMKPTFGIGLVPLDKGEISVASEIRVIEKD